MSARLSLRLCLILPLLALSACGDGWEMVPYTGTPYGDRTAGVGVQYVRKNMAPERGPVLKPEMKVEAPPVSKAPDAVRQAVERAFEARLKK